MLFKRQKTDWFLLALVALGIFLYASYQPRLRLRPQMPSEFVDLAAEAMTKGGEQKIAQAYWSCLVDDVQWRYGYGHGLPNEPPLEFNLGMQGKNAVAEDQSTRTRYWHRAQRFWYVRSAWTEEYEWNFDWTTDWVQGGGDWMHRRFQNLGGN